MVGLVLSFVLGACVDGMQYGCSLSGCAIAARECIGTRLGPCECLIQSCDDGNQCTNDGTGPNFRCLHTSRAGLACNDQNACTVSDTCTTANTCVGTLAIDDGNSCTSDTCNPATGGVHTALTGQPCNDSNACTLSDVCTSTGGCAGTMKNLVDGNACTADTCDPATGVTNPPRTGEPCNDNNACTMSDVCTSSKTCVGTAKVIDDGQGCTTDACNNTTGAVTHTLTCAASASFFCHDKYGRMTRKVVCTQGNDCSTACP